MASYPRQYHYGGLTATITKRPGFKAKLTVTADTAGAWQLRDYRLAIAEQASNLAKVPTNGTVSSAELEALRRLAISKDGNAIKYVLATEQTTELCDLAIQQDAWALQYIAQPSLDLILTAVAKDGLALQFVPADQLTYSVILTAVQQDPLALKWSGLVKGSNHNVNQLNPKEIRTIYLTALQANGALISLIPQPDYDLWAVALTENPRAIGYLTQPNVEISLLAVQQDGLVLDLINNPTDTVILAALSQNPLAIKLVKNPTAQMAQIVLDQDVTLLDYLH